MASPLSVSLCAVSEPWFLAHVIDCNEIIAEPVSSTLSLHSFKICIPGNILFLNPSTWLPQTYVILYIPKDKLISNLSSQ